MSIITNLSFGGLAGVPVSTTGTSTANTMEELDISSGITFTRTLPTIPAGGAVVGLMIAVGAPSNTVFVRLSPALGQSLDDLPVNDSYMIDYTGSNVIAYAAPGATSWKLQKQATTMVQPATATTSGTISVEASGTFTVTSSTVSANFNAGSGIVASGLYYRQVGKTVFCQVVSVTGASSYTINASGNTFFMINSAVGLPNFTSKLAMSGSCQVLIGTTYYAFPVLADTLGSPNIRIGEITTSATGTFTVAALSFSYVVP